MWRYFIISMAFSLILAQDIQLYKFRQEDCSTQCESGLVTSRDSCYFTSLVTFNESVPRHTLVYFEILELPVPNIFSLDIPSECKGFKENADHYCSQIDKYIFNITIIVKALPSFSDATLRGYIRNSNGNKIYSNIQKIPNVYGQDDAKGMLKINGNIMVNQSNCHTSIHGNELTLEFQCVSPAEPCVFDILLNDSVVVSGSRKNAEYKTTYTSGSEMLVIIKYGVCNLNGEHNIFKCSVKRETSGYLQDKAFLAFSALTILALPIAIVAVVVVVKRKRTRKRPKTWDKSHEEAEVENKHLCSRISCCSSYTETAEDDTESLKFFKFKVVDVKMKELISEIERRSTRSLFNPKYDNAIRDLLGFKVLLYAIEVKNIPVATYLITDASSFYNNPEKFEKVSRAVNETNDPTIIGSFLTLKNTHKNT